MTQVSWPGSVTTMWSLPALAQNAVSNHAKQLANPTANFISIPFQCNWNSCYALLDGYHCTLNVQPVIALELNADWNLIVRIIVPLIHQQRQSQAVGAKFGLDDVEQSFFSPAVSVGGSYLRVQN